MLEKLIDNSDFERKLKLKRPLSLEGPVNL
jgi:hypothetical protein